MPGVYGTTYIIWDVVFTLLPLFSVSVGAVTWETFVSVYSFPVSFSDLSPSSSDSELNDGPIGGMVGGKMLEFVKGDMEDIVNKNYLS